jgi:hypothetical protein
LIAIALSAERCGAKAERVSGIGRREKLVSRPSPLAASRTVKTFWWSRHNETDRVELVPLTHTALEIIYQLMRGIVGSWHA